MKLPYDSPLGLEEGSVAATRKFGYRLSADHQTSPKERTFSIPKPRFRPLRAEKLRSEVSPACAAHKWQFTLEWHSKIYRRTHAYAQTTNASAKNNLNRVQSRPKIQPHEDISLCVFQ